jgi:hypothetical protein
LNKPFSPDEYSKKVEEIKRELIDDGKYNMNLYFVSEYEKLRIKNESDSVIQSLLSN